MADRSIPEINAGSMADIAFLLLIFWLVTTTMDRDMGLTYRIPTPLDPPPGWVPPDVLDRNVLNIILNSKDNLKIEKKEGHELTDVTQYVHDFYLSQEDNMPVRHLVSEATINDTLAKLAPKIQQLERSAKNKVQWFQLGRLINTRKEWEGYRTSQQLIGDFYIMSKSAVIRFESNNGSSFEAYFSVLDQISNVLKVERNNLANKHFGISYDQLLKLGNTDPRTRSKIKAIRHQLPLKLLEPKPKNF